MTGLTDRQVITQRGAQILDALRASGAWMTRAQLAGATGKNWLSPNDLNQLERMAAAGLLDIRQRPTERGPVPRWEYRARAQQ